MHGSLIFDHAARRGVDWLTRSLRPDGSIANAASLAAAYKIPLAFALTERKESGRRVLARLNDNFQREDGHFAEADTGRRQSRHCELYEDLWLAWGARSLGELETADRVYAFIEAYFDERMGGLSSTISATPATQTFDLRSSALGGLVAIEMGADRRARGAADFTAQLLLEQPDLSQGVYLVRDARGRLVRDYSQELERYFLIRPGQARPLHYAIGLAVCLLARYATVSGEKGYATVAERYAEFTRTYLPEGLSHDYSGKLCWGLCLLGHVTGDASHRVLAARIARYLCRRQSSSGRWWPESGGAQDVDRSIDLTAELAVWLTLVARSLPYEAT